MGLLGLTSVESSIIGGSWFMAGGLTGPRAASCSPTCPPHGICMLYAAYRSHYAVRYALYAPHCVVFTLRAVCESMHPCMFYILSYCIVLYCLLFYREISSYCIVCIVLYCFVLFCIVLYCIVLYGIAISETINQFNQ